MTLLAALVHTFTALGSVAAFMALLAIGDRAWETCFLWLGVAFVIDGIDGTFARAVKVTERLPRFSGERLDLVVDYVTYVFIPAYALLAAGFLQGPLGIALVAAILLSSLFHFADVESKAEDYSFVGFPAVWNIVALYAFVFMLSPGATALLVIVCVALTFVPMKWVHPMRVPRWRAAVWAAAAAWGIAALAATLAGFDAAPAWSKLVLAAVAASTAALSIVSSIPASERS